MVDHDPQMRSFLADAARNGRHGRDQDAVGVTVSERWPISIAGVVAYNGKRAWVESKLKKAFGLALPWSPHRHQLRRPGGGLLELVWAGPARWLAVEDGIVDLEQAFASAAGDAAMVVEQSGGHCVLRISGPSAREVLAKGVPVDLGGPGFDVGSVALTQFDHIEVCLWQVDDAPSFDLAVQASYARSLLEWLLSASAEFGCELSLNSPAGRG